MPKLANHETVPIRDGKTVYFVDKNDKERIKKIQESIEARKKEAEERLARVSNREIKERNRNREARKRVFNMQERADITAAMPYGIKAEIADLLKTSRPAISNTLAGKANLSPHTLEILRTCEIVAAISEWNKKSKALYLVNPITLKYEKRKEV